MKKTILIFSLLTLAYPAVAQNAVPAVAQKGARAKVIHVEKDRTGKRFANKFSIECTAAGEIWETGRLNKRTRKMYLRAGATDLRVGVAPTPGTVDAMWNGTRTAHWSLLKAGKSHDYGHPANMTVMCTGPGKYYAHAEWHRKHGLLLDIDLGG